MGNNRFSATLTESEKIYHCTDSENCIGKSINFCRSVQVVFTRGNIKSGNASNKCFRNLWGSCKFNFHKHFRSGIPTFGIISTDRQSFQKIFKSSSTRIGIIDVLFVIYPKLAKIFLCKLFPKIGNCRIFSNRIKNRLFFKNKFKNVKTSVATDKSRRNFIRLPFKSTATSTVKSNEEICIFVQTEVFHFFVQCHAQKSLLHRRFCRRKFVQQYHRGVRFRFAVFVRPNGITLCGVRSFNPRAIGCFPIDGHPRGHGIFPGKLKAVFRLLSLVCERNYVGGINPLVNANCDTRQVPILRKRADYRSLAHARCTFKCPRLVGVGSASVGEHLTPKVCKHLELACRNFLWFGYHFELRCLSLGIIALGHPLMWGRVQNRKG